MKKRLSLLLVVIMAFTVFWIPGQGSAAFAEGTDDVVAEEGTVQAMEGENEDPPAETFTVHYDANGGTGAPEDQVKETGVDLTLSSTKPSRDGYDFVNWKDEAGNEYAPEATYSEDADLNLTAQWKVKKFKVTFVDGQGKTLKTQTVEYGKAATAPSDPTRSGYTFKGWDKDFSSVKEAITVTAKWEKNPVPDTVGTVTAKYTSDKTSVTLSWSFKSDSGKFTGVVVTFNGKTYKIDNTKTKSKKFTKLSDGTYYKYSVKPYYKSTNGKAVSGKALTKAPKKNGAYKKGNYQYYYKNGVKQRDTTIMFKDTSYGTSKYKLYHYYDSDGIFRGRSKAMYKKIKGMSSTSYLIAIDRTNNVMCIYKGGKNKWYPYKYWSCVTGRLDKSDYHPTPLGTHTIKSKKLTFSGYGVPEEQRNRYSVWYCSRFCGSVFIHSQLYKYGQKSGFIPGGGTMGRNASHGCVRLFKDYAYWVYKNCGKGTKVVVMK